MTKIYSIEEICDLLNMTRQALHLHVLKGLKVTRSTDHHLHKICGEKVVSITHDDLIAYFLKEYQAGHRHALKHLLKLNNNIKIDSKQ